MGKAPEDPHWKKKDRAAGDKPARSMDYKSVGQTYTGEKEEGDKETATIMRDGETTNTFAHVVDGKGRGDGWIVDKIVEDIASLGYTDVIIKGDGEPALVQVMEAIRERRQQRTLVENPPAYDPQSNGAAEKAVDHVMGELRTLKLALESRINLKIGTKWKIVKWMVEHVGSMINRYQVGHDGKTPFRRIMGKECNQKVLEFGERVLIKPKRRQRSNRKQALDGKWRYATWIGVTARSNEHMVILPNGGSAYRVRSVRRVPEGDPWRGEDIQNVMASPKKPKTEERAQCDKDKIQPCVTIEGESNIEVRGIVEDSLEEVEKLLRDFKVSKFVLEKYGLTEGCQGCEGTLMNKRRRHTTACRTR